MASCLIQDLLEFEEFDIRNGTVYLTHPKELIGGQAAVMNSHRSLMFVKPLKYLAYNDWRQLFNNLKNSKLILNIRHWIISDIIKNDKIKECIFGHKHNAHLVKMHVAQCGI